MLTNLNPSEAKSKDMGSEEEFIEPKEQSCLNKYKNAVRFLAFIILAGLSFLAVYFLFIKSGGEEGKGNKENNCSI